MNCFWIKFVCFYWGQFICVRVSLFVFSVFPPCYCVVVTTIIHEVLLTALHTCPGMHYKKGIG